jgi:hypothetical protein
MTNILFFYFLFGLSILYYRCKMNNKCVKELVNLLMYSWYTPKCFGKCSPSSLGLGALEATQVLPVLWAYTDHNPYTPTKQTLLV